MSQPTPLEATSRPQGNLQIHRIYEGITETGICEKCKGVGVCCFTIGGFPNSKLCKPCGIYSKKYPTTFISQDVWTEPRDYRVRMCIWHLLLSIWIMSVPYIHDVQDAIKFAFALNFVIIMIVINWFWSDSPKEVRKMIETFVSMFEDTFDFLSMTFFLTDVDYLDDTKSVSLQKIKRDLDQQTRQLSASKNEITELVEEVIALDNQLGDVDEGKAGVLEQMKDPQEYDCSPAKTTTMDLNRSTEQMDGLKMEIVCLLEQNKFEEYNCLLADTTQEEVIELNDELGDVEEDSYERGCSLAETITSRMDKKSTNQLDDLKDEMTLLVRHLEYNYGFPQADNNTTETTEVIEEIDELSMPLANCTNKVCAIKCYTNKDATVTVAEDVYNQDHLMALVKVTERLCRFHEKYFSIEGTTTTTHSSSDDDDDSSESTERDTM